MTLDTQGFFAVEPGMVVVIGALAGMTARAGQILTGSRVKDIFSYGMSKNTVFPMTFTAYLVDGCLDHGRMVGAMRRVAIIAGICHLVAVLCCIIAFKGRPMTFAADVTFLPFEQPAVIAGVWRMAGHAAVIFVTNQVVMG